MAELTERELKICHLFLTMLNPKFEDAPMDVKQGLLKTTLAVRNIPFDEGELVDLVQALNAEQDLVMKNAIGIISEHGGIGDISRLLKRR